MERPLSNNDLSTIANYLEGTKEELWIAVSELGFDPNAYSAKEVANWLLEGPGVFLATDGIWHRRTFDD